MKIVAKPTKSGQRFVVTKDGETIQLINELSLNYYLEVTLMLSASAIDSIFTLLMHQDFAEIDMGNVTTKEASDEQQAV